MFSFLILNFAIVIRRRQTPHVKETTEGINNKIYNNEEDVALRTGIVQDREPYVLVDNCKWYTWLTLDNLYFAIQQYIFVCQILCFVFSLTDYVVLHNPSWYNIFLWTNQTYNSSCKFEMSRSLHKRQPAAASTAYWYVRTARWWSLVRNKLLSLCIITHFNL